MAQPRKRVTIKEVAEATGLSAAGVSYALRGLQVSDETRERVLKTAAELGYEVDPIARALASGRTGTVGLLCGSLEDLWQQSLAAAMGRELLARDRYAFVVDADGDPRREESLARRLRDQRVDGLIVFSLDPESPVWAEVTAALPVVTIGDALAGATVAGEVIFDNEAGVDGVLTHLHALGHRTVTVLTPSRASTPDRPAEALVRTTAARLGIDATVVHSDHSIDSAAVAATRALQAKARPSAVFCLSDSMAYGVYAAANALGLRMPDDLSVAGYDDHPMSRLLTPPLTTVEWNMPEVVRLSVEVVVSAIEGAEPAARQTIHPVLSTRASTAPPSGAGRRRGLTGAVGQPPRS